MTPEREAEIREYLAGIRYRPIKSEEMALELLSALQAERERADAAGQAAVELAATLKAATEWRDISTADHTAECRLLRSGSEVWPGYWHDGSRNYWKKAGWYDECDRGDELTVKPNEPTHWLPLPTSPAGGAHD